MDSFFGYLCIETRLNEADSDLQAHKRAREVEKWERHKREI